MNINLERIERDGGRVFNNVQINGDRTVEREVLEIGLQCEVVVLWNDICGQYLPSHCDICPASFCLSPTVSMHFTHVISI